MITNGKIAECSVLDSREQRGKAVKSRRYLKQFIGLSRLNGKLSGRVDAISGATVSSRAMENAALEALKLAEDIK